MSILSSNIRPQSSLQKTNVLRAISFVLCWNQILQALCIGETENVLEFSSNYAGFQFFLVESSNKGCKSKCCCSPDRQEPFIPVSAHDCKIQMTTTRTIARGACFCCCMRTPPSCFQVISLLWLGIFQKYHTLAVSLDFQMLA